VFVTAAVVDPFGNVLGVMHNRTTSTSSRRPSRHSVDVLDLPDRRLRSRSRRGRTSGRFR
jgi:hypothetical protein